MTSLIRDRGRVAGRACADPRGGGAGSFSSATSCPEGSRLTRLTHAARCRGSRSGRRLKVGLRYILGLGERSMTAPRGRVPTHAQLDEGERDPMPEQQVPVDEPLAGPEEHGIAHVDQRGEQREVLPAVASEDDVAGVSLRAPGRGDVRRPRRRGLRRVAAPSLSSRSEISCRIGEQPHGAAVARDPRERKVRDERCCRVERREAQPAVKPTTLPLGERSVKW